MTGSFSRRQILAAAGSAPLLFFGGPVLAGKSTKYTGEGVHQGVRQIVLVSVSITTSGRITTIKIDIDVLGSSWPIDFETFLLAPDPENPIGYDGIPLGVPTANRKLKKYSLTRKFSEPVFPTDVIRLVFDDIDEDDIVMDIPLTAK
jgi:hypothetical protein